MTKVHLPNLVLDRDRHGNTRVYVRASAGTRRKVRVRAEIGSAGFMAAYEAALLQLGRVNGAPENVKPNTLHWLAYRYFGSPVFRELDAKSQRVRAAVIESCLREPIAPGSRDTFADIPLRLFGPRHVITLRDRRADKPAAANNRRKYLSSMFGWAVEHMPDMIAHNPVREVKKRDYERKGFRPWTEHDLERFEAAYAIGTKERLALALMLFTGARRSDAVSLGPSCVSGGLIRFVPVKTRRKRKEPTPKPFLPELARIVAATKLQGRNTFLVTNYGKPFSIAGFGNWFGDACRKIGLADCTPHGLRKLGAMRAAESGATHYQLMAIFDWSRPAEAQPYIEAAERKRAAAAAMSLLATRRG